MAKLTTAARLLLVALVVLPLVRATAVAGTSVSQSPPQVFPDRTTALSARVGAASPTAFTWHVVLGPSESLTRLRDGRIAVVARWPPVPAWLTVAGPDMIELTVGPALIPPAYPLVVTSSIVFNPDALP